MKIRTPLFAAALVASAIGCSGSDDSTSGATSMASLLARLPLAALDDPEGSRSDTIQISLGDTLAAAELTGFPRPDIDDLDASIRWYVDVAGSGPIEQGGTGYSFDGPDFPPFSTALGFADEIEDELGFSPFAIDSYATVFGPPTQIAVFAGDLPLAGDLVDVGDGIVSAGDGDDLQIDPENRTAIRPLGRPHRMAESDGLVAISLSTPLIEAWLAGGESLADDHDLAVAAEALDAAGSVVGTLVMSSFEAVDVGDDAPTSPIDVPFSVVGIGTAEIDDAPGNVIVYVFDTADDAEEVLPVIDNGWRNGFLVTVNQPITDSFDIVSVEQDDRVVVITANVTDSATTRRPLEMLIRAEPLFTHTG